MQLATATREAQRAQAENESLDRARVTAEQSAVKARETARQYHTALEAQRAREEGLQEGRKMGLEEAMNGYYALEAAAPKAQSSKQAAKQKSVSARAAYERGRARGFDEGRDQGA